MLQTEIMDLYGRRRQIAISCPIVLVYDVIYVNKPFRNCSQSVGPTQHSRWPNKVLNRQHPVRSVRRLRASVINEILIIDM